MKATGMIRRIDDLGRVVIPKEIRQMLRMREGDPLEVYVGNDDEIVFKKYLQIAPLSTFALQYAEVLEKAGNYPVVVCDRDRVICATGTSKGELLGKRITPALEKIMKSRELYIARPEDKQIQIVEGIDWYALIEAPIVPLGEVCGSIMFALSKINISGTYTAVKLIETGAAFLGKQMEI